MEPDSTKVGVSQNKVDTGCIFECNPVFNPYGKCNSDCFKICPLVCKTLCDDRKGLPPLTELLPQLPPPQPIPRPVLPVPNVDAHNINQNHLLVTSMIIMATLIGAAILVCIFCSILRAHYLRQRNSRRSGNPPLFFGTQEDFLDEDQGPEIDHPTWYINTIGLQQSIIDSITVFKYNKEERLIEGTECSVCLNEFQEDENLRLLPKCSHAFHIPCIDTWLRSHKNCPLCRAPIVSDFFFQIDLSVPTSSDLSSIGETQMENSGINSQFISNQGEDDGTSEVSNARGEDMNCRLQIEEETNGGNSKLSLNLSVLRNHSRVQSDLVEGRQSLATEMQPIRRSVSMDSSSAIAIHSAVADIISSKHQDNSETQISQLRKSKLKNVSKQVSNGSLSFRRMMTSSSIGHALQKGPISMKRSFSSSGKCSSSRNSRSQDSILPL